MSAPSKHHRLLFAVALAILAFAGLPARGALSWLDRPIAGVLVDPDGVVSSFGLPTWDGIEQGLRFQDEILEIDGRPLVAAPGRYRAAVWDDAVEKAAAAGQARVRVTARTRSGVRTLDLAVSRLDRLAFWLIGAAPLGIALLYAGAALIALWVSPRGRLARTFAKTALLAALFLLTLFDYHTSRTLVPFFHLSFALVPMGFFVLPLRLPDELPWLARRRWVVAALDGAGLALGLGMITAQLSGGTTLALRQVCTALFGASFFFFAATFLGRFYRADGARRATMRALFVSMVPAHVVIGAAFVLGSLQLRGAPVALLAVPALALTPLSSVAALIRHDLWGSRALLSRVLTRVVIALGTSALAVALGAGAAVASGAPVGPALLSAAVAGLFAGVLVAPALRLADRALFPARADYKPTIEQLSEELTSLHDPAEVARAVERTVRRFLPCERVELVSARGARAESGVRLRASGPPGEDAGGDHLTLDVLFRDEPLAALHVGQKRGGALFTTDDVDLLRTIANQAALALSHAHSYQELELRRRQQAAASRVEREALVETVAAEVAHEIRYPINYFRSIFRRGAGELCLDAEDVDIGCDEVERLSRLVHSLRRVQGLRLSRRVTAVEELVLKVERLLRDQLGTRRLVLSLPGAPGLRCDPDQLTQVLANLVSNALDAAGEGGRVGVAFVREREQGLLEVWDEGPGFSEDPARLFTPWYTTKPRGTGLGLAISHRIVRAHGWKIEASREASRTRFVIAVPHADLALSPGVVEEEVA